MQTFDYTNELPTSVTNVGEKAVIVRCHIERDGERVLMAEFAVPPDGISYAPYGLGTVNTGHPSLGDITVSGT